MRKPKHFTKWRQRLYLTAKSQILQAYEWTWDADGNVSTKYAAMWCASARTRIECRERIEACVSLITLNGEGTVRVLDKFTGRPVPPLPQWLRESKYVIGDRVMLTGAIDPSIDGVYVVVFR